MQRGEETPSGKQSRSANNNQKDLFLIGRNCLLKWQFLGLYRDFCFLMINKVKYMLQEYDF